jgi:hypothetical protein
MRFNWVDREGGYGGEYNVDVLRRDTLIGLTLLSVTTMAEPPTPTHGDAYYNPAGSTGAFWGIPDNQDKIVVYLTEKPISPAPAPGYTPAAGWVAIPIPRGNIAEVQDSPTPLQFYYGYGIWAPLGTLVGADVLATPNTIPLRDGSGGAAFAGVLTVGDIAGAGALNITALGAIDIRPTGSGGAGQATTIVGGPETGGGPTGDVNVGTLSGHYGSGALNLTTADALVDGDGGDILISAGDAAGLIHNGGKLRMKFGKRDTSGVDGTLTVTDGYGTLHQTTSITGTKFHTALTSASARIKAIRKVTAAGAVTVGADDDTIVMAKSSPATTAVTGPAAAAGRRFTIKDGNGDAFTYNITVTPASGTIDGAATAVLNVNYDSQTYECDGTNWYKV